MRVRVCASLYGVCVCMQHVGRRIACGNQISPSAIFCYVGSEHSTQVIMCGPEFFYPLGHLAGHGHVFKKGDVLIVRQRKYLEQQYIRWQVHNLIYLTKYGTRVNDEVNKTKKFFSSVSQYNSSPRNVEFMADIKNQVFTCPIGILFVVMIEAIFYLPLKLKPKTYHNYLC